MFRRECRSRGLASRMNWAMFRCAERARQGTLPDANSPKALEKGRLRYAPRNPTTAGQETT